MIIVKMVAPLTTVEPLPPTHWDQPFEFGLLDGTRGECRLRCYRTHERVAVFVVTGTRNSSDPCVGWRRRT
jgi:hypothetical protein